MKSTTIEQIEDQLSEACTRCRGTKKETFGYNVVCGRCAGSGFERDTQHREIFRLVQGCFCDACREYSTQWENAWLKPGNTLTGEEIHQQLEKRLNINPKVKLK